MGREQSLRLSITISSGSGTGTITPAWDQVRWLRIVPVAESDTYTLTVKDKAGFIMLKRTAQEGTFSELVDMSLGIMGSIAISSASQDGTFTVLFDMP